MMSSGPSRNRNISITYHRLVGRWAKNNPVLECVINISEGQSPETLAKLSAAVAADLLDVHTDHDHHRSVFTLRGTHAPRRLAACAIDLLNIHEHAGVHPRLGVVDVVPFVALGNATFDEAIHGRNAFAQWAAKELKVPIFYYGPERTLPDIRRTAWTSLFPDIGPRIAHPTAGAMCVGVRKVLVAYNIVLAETTVSAAKIVLNIRQPGLRALCFLVNGQTQISMNLTDLDIINVDTAYDIVAEYGNVTRAELVGLMPMSALTKIKQSRWNQLDIAVDKTIEARCSKLI